MTISISNSFNVSVVVRSDPAWYPAWQAPGVITTIPNSSLQAAINANGWTGEDFPGGGGWPGGLYAWSGGTLAYVNGQPFFCICGGGHATHYDNSIYALGPLYGVGADTPTWSRLGEPTELADLTSCSQHYLDGRPASRHTAGDFSYGVGSDGVPRIIMLWENSAVCSTGGTTPGIDVFDINAREWDNAKTPAITHGAHSIGQRVHAPSVFHPQTGLWYAVAKGLGSYDPVTKVFNVINNSLGLGPAGDSSVVTMGPRDYLYFCKNQSDPKGRINVVTGSSEEWGADNFPIGGSRTVSYDSVQDRLYIPTPGISVQGQVDPPGEKTVSWLDASASSSPTWVSETFHGDTPDLQESAGTFGRWSFVPELRGFVLNNSSSSETYFYRTSI